MNKIYSLKEIFEQIRLRLNVEELREVDIWGEVDNFKQFGNMVRFILKDSAMKLDVILFDKALAELDVNIENGMQLVCKGHLSIYTAESKCQLNCIKVLETGRSKYEHEFQEIYRRLEKEGIFEGSKDKKILSCPRTIGIVCKKDSEGYRDVLAIWKERYPWVRMIHAECEIQGKNASISILKAIKRLEEYQVDTIIIARGGGDKMLVLPPYNSEELVRYIATMNIPVISGVGHESDYTLLDYVAVIRGATPTHAAVLASVDKEVFMGRLMIRLKKMYSRIQMEFNEIVAKAYQNNLKALKQIIDRQITENKNSLRGGIFEIESYLSQICIRGKTNMTNCVQRMEGEFSKSLIIVRNSMEKRNALTVVHIKDELKKCGEDINYKAVCQLENKLYADIQLYRMFIRNGMKKECSSMDLILNKYMECFWRSKKTLEACSVQETLKRGYAIVLNEANQMIRSVEELSSMDKIGIEMKDGRKYFLIKEIK